MIEADLNGKARDAIRSYCHRAYVYKTNDRMTSGIPDTIVTWRGYTSWLEFKHLDCGANIHTELDALQCVELNKLEEQCGRAWVVAYRKANPRKLLLPCTVFYRPSALTMKRQPNVESVLELDEAVTVMHEHLQTRGVVAVAGYNHQAVAALLWQTHKAL